MRAATDRAATEVPPVLQAGHPLTAAARAALDHLAREHRHIVALVARLRGRVAVGEGIAVEALGNEAATRLSIQEELGEQILYPAAAAIGGEAPAYVERLRLLHAHARVLVDDIRLEHGDPHRIALLADELERICEGYVAGHEQLVGAIDALGAAPRATGAPSTADGTLPNGLVASLGSALASALDQLIESVRRSRNDAAGRAADATGA